MLLGLSALVVVCIVSEAGKRGGTLPEDSVSEKEGTEEAGKKETEAFKKKKVTEETQIRVLLKTNGFESFYHSDVKITSDKAFSVMVDGQEKSLAAGKTVTFSASDSSWKKKKIVLEPTGGARLKVKSITRQSIHPSYRHRIQLVWKKQGFLVINQLPLEEYLYAVVPSELSTTNKMEALKAQAICARSYAYQQMNSDRYDKYHADIDDSVSCQVYNNVPEDRRSRKAVKSTRGMVVVDKKNRVIQTYYYSTSWGYTASGQDVWNTASEVPYLKERLQITESSQKKSGIKSLNLSSESTFENFIREEYCDTYDSSSGWYRWNVMLMAKSLSARIDNLLATCYASNPENVLTQENDGSYTVKALKPIGRIKKLRVEKREKSGLVTELVIVGKKNVVKVCTQYNIRVVLAPLYELIYYNDGASQTTMSLLPSAAFYIVDATKDNETAFQIVGGGFGHGTGMSQCGAQEMAKEGKSYREILAHYYAGTHVTTLSKLEK